MSMVDVIRRLRGHLEPGSSARRGQSKNVSVGATDLARLLEDYARIDARLRAQHVQEFPRGYPPRAQMLARCASDPGAFAGYKGERTMGGWISDAILAVERHVTEPLLLEVVERNWNAGPDALVAAILALPDPGVEDFSPQAIAQLQRERRMRR